MRTIIQGVATRIEERKYQSAQDAIQGMRLAFADRQRAHELIQADKRIHISYQALRTTVETFSEINQIVIGKLEQAANARSETRHCMTSATEICRSSSWRRSGTTTSRRFNRCKISVAVCAAESPRSS